MADGIAVACTFAADGRVQVKRIELNGRWHTVEQGRQWLDENGRHVLVMLAGRQVEELLLERQTMTWRLKPRSRPTLV